MFASRFTKRPTGGLNRSLSSDQSEQTLSTNRVFGNMRSGRLKSLQDSGKEQQDSTNSNQYQQSVSRRNTEVTRSQRYTYNRKTNASGIWKKQSTVRQADVQVFPPKNLRNADNKQTKLQPAVIGTNTFQPQPKPAQDTHSPRNAAANNQRRLSNVSEQPSELSSSFCYVNQGNLSKSTGVEDFRQSGYSVFSPEPIIGKTVTDFCAYCLNKQNFSVATHHCTNCGPCGRYLCQICLGPHNEFTENHNVQSLSGQSFRKQNDETHPKQEKEPEKTVVLNQGSHPNFIKDVSVKTLDDDQSCQITGFCQLQNGTIVLTEMNNKSIKTIDSQNYQVTNTLRLQNYPMDICCMGEKEALVILYKSTIQYISIDTDDHISLTQQKVLEHDCICLAFCNGKTYVGSSKSLYIYDENWTELDKITNELFGDDRIFSDQFSIAVSDEDDITKIYIADENNGMYSIEIMGHEITTTWKFKDCNTFKASGMCINSSGNVLLSDRGSERLIKMNGEGMILGILLDSNSGIHSLNIPFQDKISNNLIISLSGKDIFKVFDFK
ncbi:uncharacterized protein LOC123551460 [Mercenaria mercenaria]|uniref:uncharacterized protein LOC123551460 n=1 Tax=Mercenaria mercenaria TaxID=6596 RepID=UPI00234F43CD|nr:uncharacterized protein LOC123551460 [Mercenaria mercenaria]